MSMRQSRRSAKAEKATVYADLPAMMVDLAAALQPPERLLPSQAAEKYRMLQIPGAYNGPWMNKTTPYMVEPMDVLVDRTKRACIFVGPAQSGKSDALILNSILYTTVCDPIDTIVYQTSQTVAADFSRTRLDRMNRHSPAAGAQLLPGGNDDTVHAKHYKSGIVVNLSWPTINEMSGRPRGLVILTDYDRMPQDVDGEGSPFDLGMKRTTTFRTKAKTICESSPGFEVQAGSAWSPTGHEAPPCDGILALYNRGDRRRWQWKCPHCREWFEPEFELLDYPTDCDVVTSGMKAKMRCPRCSALIGSDEKYELNRAGRWVREGQRLTADDELVGTARESDIASFWLKGVAAAFASWANLVISYRNAEAEFERTGSQEAIKTTVNVDQGVPYVRRGQGISRRPEDLRSRADEWLKGTVPADVRFLLAHVDVQGRKFVVQVHGIRPGRPYGITVIDRFDVTKSRRLDADGDPLPIEPNAHAEDWQQLVDELAEREYAMADDPALRMRVRQVFCDSGGRDGVTTRAYQCWLDLRRTGMHTRFQLVKGDPTPGAPRARITYPDSSKRDKNSPLRGDVPVLMLNPNVLKDQLDGMLTSGAINYPGWLDDTWFQELCLEVRELKGWVGRGRNESWDLLYYCLGSLAWYGVERWDWEKPPTWALPAGVANSLCRRVEPDEVVAKPRYAATAPGGKSMADFARALAG